MGLNVRVGMEDNVLYRRGEPVVDNAQLVERTVRIAHELDRRPATPDEARELFALRGRAPERPAGGGRRAGGSAMTVPASSTPTTRTEGTRRWQPRTTAPA